ncbi:MAG: hypothetical protein GY910_28530 [bacterium]|nr:hypothetical protein [bacterium]
MGWNVFGDGFPAPDLCGRSGSDLPFRLERDPRDPRKPVRERDPTHVGYVERVVSATQDLIVRRLLLPDDASRYVAPRLE